MGAILNDRPDLFRVAVAGVPFVDVMTTMYVEIALDVFLHMK